jgi:magnesium transporter
MKLAKKPQRKRRRRYPIDPPGTAPGTITVDPEAPPPVVRVIAYGPDAIVERPVSDPKSLKDELGKWPVVWVNVDGLGDAAVIAALGEVFGLHPLALEDAAQVHQRAKVERYPSHDFIVARMVNQGERIDTEQLSLFLGTNFVVTFQERSGDCWDPLRERMRRGLGRLRRAGPDYLAYALLDGVVDAYFPLLETLGDRIEGVEEEVIAHPGRNTISRVHAIKRDLLLLRRALWPLREALGGLSRDPTPRVTDETRLFLRDCHDHTIQIIELVETYRKLAADLTDVYLSSASNRMNEVMKVLTIITTIFMPLGLIAGVYGMNFHDDRSPWNMPELGWHYGYPFALGLMAVVALIMLWYFYRKGWMGDGGAARAAADLPDDTLNSAPVPAKKVD